MHKQWLAMATVLVSGVLPVALRAQALRTAAPGTVNYVEGQASIEGQALNQKQDGNTQLETNQSLSTGEGKTEMLLSPGVFVRLGSNSEIRLVSARLVDPAIEIVRGEAMVEVDQKPNDVQLDVLEHGATASILKAGLYGFDGDRGLVKVMDGKVRVTENREEKEFGKGKEVAIDGEPLKTVSFDRKTEDDLYRWSSVRSGYLAEANSATVQNIYMGYLPNWGSGWYWDPYFASWSWLPGDGFFNSPFGYPFFSPAYVIRAPYRFGLTPGFRAGVRGGFPTRGFAPQSHFNSAPRAGRGFSGGARGFSGGSRGASGGFHGGGRR